MAQRTYSQLYVCVCVHFSCGRSYCNVLWAAGIIITDSTGLFSLCLAFLFSRSSLSHPPDLVSFLSACWQRFTSLLHRASLSCCNGDWVRRKKLSVREILVFSPLSEGPLMPADPTSQETWPLLGTQILTRTDKTNTHTQSSNAAQ